MSTGLHIRETHKYRAGYAELDEWKFIGEIHIFNQHIETDDDEDDQGESWTENKMGCVNVLHGPYSKETIDRAVRDSFFGGCRCEHDCCGHTQWYAGDVHVAFDGEHYIARWSEYCYLNV